MEPLDYLKAIVRRWPIILACVAVGFGIAWFTTPDKPTALTSERPTYEATTVLLERPASSMPLSYIGLYATRGQIPAAVAEQLGMPGQGATIASQVVLERQDDLGTLEITATAPTPERAITIADTFANEILKYVNGRGDLRHQARVQALQQQMAVIEAEIARLSGVSPTDALGQAQLEQQERRYAETFGALADTLADRTTTDGIDVLQAAESQEVILEEEFTLTDDRAARIWIALAAALLLGSAIALVIERFDTRVRDRNEVQSLYRAPVVAEVPQRRTRRRFRYDIASVVDPVGYAAEAYRTLRSALLLLPPRRLENAGDDAHPIEFEGVPRVLLVVSAEAGEGKTTTVVNLAAVLAETGKQVLVLDLDFLNPEAWRYLGVKDGPGIAEVLESGDAEELIRVAQTTNVPGVRLVTSGTVTDRPIALPGRIAAVVSEARYLSDVVIIDSPPLLAATDAVDIMPSADAVLVVARCGRTRADDAVRTRELVGRMRVPLLGICLIGVRLRRRGLLGVTAPRSTRSRTGQRISIASSVDGERQ